MKTFKEFVTEARGSHVPVVALDKQHSDLSHAKTVNEINKNLRLQTTQEFESIDVALHKIKKILSMYSVELGDVNIPDDKYNKGSLTIPVSQGTVTGERLTPEVKSGDVHASNDAQRKTGHSLHVSYSEGENGYSVSASIK